MKKHLKISALLLGTTLVLTAAIISVTPASAASDSYKLLAPLPCNSSLTTGTSVACSGGQATSLNIKDYVQYTFNLLIALAAVAAVFMIVWGGLEYMTTDAIQGKKSGLDKLRNAVYGLLLVLCSYLILKTIDPRFVQIPNGLVPQLVLNTNIGTGGLTTIDEAALQQLDSKIDASNVEAKAAVADARQASATAIAAGQDVQTLNDQIANLEMNGDPENKMPDLIQQRDAKLDEQNTALATKSVKAAQAQLAVDVGNVAIGMKDASADEIAKAEADGVSAIQEHADTRIADLQKLGATGQSQIQAVQDQASYAEASLNLLQVDQTISSRGVISSWWNSDADKKTMSGAIADAQHLLPTITDPALHAKLDAQIKTTQANFLKKYYK